MWPPPPTRQSHRRSPSSLESSPAETVTEAGATAQRLPSVFTLASVHQHASYPHTATAPPSARMYAASRHVRPARRSTTRSVTSASLSPVLTQHETSPARHGAMDALLAAAGDDDEESRATTSTAVARTRPLTNSERGRQFRLREKMHEQNLIQQLKQLRLQIAHLESSQQLAKQHALTTRLSGGGSLERITRELYAIFQFGLEGHSSRCSAGLDQRERSSLSVARSKESFLRSVVDRDVVYGDLLGVEALIDQWRKHTASYSKFEIEIDHVEPIAGSQASPIVVIHTTLHARFSRETLPTMFPWILERRPGLAAKFINRDITFHCVSRFTFSEEDRIVTYLVDISFVEALVKAVGSARDVAALMEFSVVTPLMTLQAVDELVHQRYLNADQFVDGDHHGGTNKLYGRRLETRSYTHEHVAPMQEDDWRGLVDPELQHQRRHPSTPFNTSAHDEESDDDTPGYIFQV